MFTTLTILPWYTGIILAMALFFGMHHVSMLDLYGRDVANEDIANCEQIVTRVLLDKSNYTDSVTQSPYFAGIITSSMVWVTYAWLRRLLPRTSFPVSSHAMFKHIVLHSHRNAGPRVHAPHPCDHDRPLRLQLLPGDYPRPRDLSKAIE